MIVSHRHKFIFLKTRKTAGTSIEIGLSKYCGAGDIISRILDHGEAIRQQLGYLGPQNDAWPFNRYSPRDRLSLVKRRHKWRYYNHMPAAEVCAREIAEIGYEW